ncbi:MAG: DUF4838 domain-containing protein, partial [Puniceicoccales bacterium]|nr:DUF4838 domain-containing protein [Puniceicoccales bacterium]
PTSKLLGCLAYANCERVPDFLLHPNIFPVLATDRSQWRDPAFREHDSELIRNWAQSGVRHFGLYEYYHGAGFAVPRFFYDEQIDSLRWAAANRASLFYAEVYPDWGFDGPKAWLAAQLLLRPSLNSALLLRLYFVEAHGPAAAAMREFHTLTENCWRERGGAPRRLKFFHSENAGELVPAAVQKQMRDAIRRAEAAFPPPAVGVEAERAAAANPLRDPARLLRQQMRTRMAALAFGVTDAFLDWHRLRASLLRRAAPRTAAETLEIWRLLETEPALRKAMFAALERWNTANINPGEPRQAGEFFAGVVGATVTERLLVACGAGLRGDPNDTAWREAFNEISAGARRRGLGALITAATQPQKLRWPLREKFSEQMFVPPSATSRLTPRPVSLPVAPWIGRVADSEHVSFGPVRETPATSANTTSASAGASVFLRVRGVRGAHIAREVNVTAVGWIVAKTQVRGRVSAGASASLFIRYFDIAGEELPVRHAALVLPADIPEWRPLVCVGRVPAGAVAARVMLICRNQEATETLDWDGLSVGTL